MGCNICSFCVFLTPLKDYLTIHQISVLNIYEIFFCRRAMHSLASVTTAGALPCLYYTYCSADGGTNGLASGFSAGGGDELLRNTADASA